MGATHLVFMAASRCYARVHHTRTYALASLPPQAGNRVKAMRSLVRSGDTEKIVFFASEWPPVSG